jgi:hypothetical protein
MQQIIEKHFLTVHRQAEQPAAKKGKQGLT